MEQLQVPAELPVVTRLGLLGTLEVLREFLLGWEGGPVDALQLLVLLVAAMVSTGDREELERLQLGRIPDVGAGAEVDELTVLVE
jgi:hypothetical protein